MAITLNALKREGKASAVRAAGNVPGVVYGRETEPTSLAVPYNDLEKVYAEAGTSALIELTIEDSAPVHVIIKDWQLDPVTHLFRHIDFYQVVMGEEIESNIPLNFLGEAPAVKVHGGTLMTSTDSVTVKCLPKDLADSIDVDLTVLATFEDSIHQGDIALPEGMTLVGGEDVLIAKVNAPLSKEQLEKMESTETADVSAVEVEEKGKAEEGEAEDAK